MMNILERKLLDASKETIPWMNLDHGNSTEKEQRTQEEDVGV